MRPRSIGTGSLRYRRVQYTERYRQRADRVPYTGSTNRDDVCTYNGNRHYCRVYCTGHSANGLCSITKYRRASDRHSYSRRYSYRWQRTCGCNRRQCSSNRREPNSVLSRIRVDRQYHLLLYSLLL